MEFTTALICVALTTVALCYGWGMRGTVIGGEKGAMLPGLYLGMLLAWFSGSEIIRENFWFFGAAGLMGMTFGGTEPYGETIGFVLHHGRFDYKPVRGYTGLAFKGALWFAVAAAFIAMSFSAASGLYYKWYDLVIFFVALPLVQEAGYHLFNKPYDKKKGIYPKLFFSLTRREEWGRNVATLIALITLGLIRSDDFMLVMITAGLFSGAVGWVLAIWFFDISNRPLSNGKWLFGKLNELKMIGGWKFMEFTLGAVGGLGISLCYCLNFSMVCERIDAVGQNGGVWQAFEGIDKYAVFAVALCFVGIYLINSVAYFMEKKEKLVNSFVSDLIERPLYNVVPMLLVMLGSGVAARLMTFAMLYLVLAIKCAFERFVNFRFLPAWQTVLSLAAVAAFVGDFYLGGYSFNAVWQLGLAPYFIFECLWVFAPGEVRKITAGAVGAKAKALRFGSLWTVYTFFIVLIVALSVVGFLCFA